jgi:hypothetical protein
VLRFYQSFPPRKQSVLRSVTLDMTVGWHTVNFDNEIIPSTSLASATRTASGGLIVSSALYQKSLFDLLVKY